MKFVILIFAIFLNLYGNDRLKVASWNVENLFDDRFDGLEYPEYIPNMYGWNRKKLNIKLSNIAKVICELHADVVGLQEIENSNILQLLQKRLKKMGCIYPYSAITDKKHTVVHVALLSKIPIRYKNSIEVTHYSEYRDILEVLLDSAVPLRIFVNHWKSKMGSESERVLSAKALKKRLLELPLNSEYIIIGDFNSDVEEYKEIDKKHNDTDGVTGINNILKTTIDNKMVRCTTLKSKECAKEFCLMNLWMQLPPKKRWSHNFYGKKSAIDAILIPTSLCDNREWEYLKGSFGVFKAKYLFGKKGNIKRWRVYNKNHLGYGYSDHLPVYALFELKKESKLSQILSLFGNKKSVNRFATPKPKVVTLSKLLNNFKISSPVIVKRVNVVFKRKNSALVVQNGSFLFLYGCAKGLKEGYSYDITIYATKIYKGLKEAIDIEISKPFCKVEVSKYIPKFKPQMLNKEKVGMVVKDIEGIYRDNYIIGSWGKCRVYFKKRAYIPQNGVKIKILRGQIGYYKGKMELIVWSKKDFKIYK